MKYKNLKLLKERKAPEGTRWVLQKELKINGATIENNRIFPNYDSDKFSWEIDFYNYFVNGLKVSKQGDKRVNLYPILKKALKDIYGSELKRSSLMRYIRAFSNIWKYNKDLGIKIIPHDNSKKGAKKFVASDNIQHFSHAKAIKKIDSVNIENLDKNRNQMFLVDYNENKKNIL